MNIQDENAPEIEALKKARDFPRPDPARDKKVKGAMGEALVRKARQSVRRWWIAVGVAVAALIGIGITVLENSKNVETSRNVLTNAKPKMYRTPDTIVMANGFQDRDLNKYRDLTRFAAGGASLEEVLDKNGEPISFLGIGGGSGNAGRYGGLIEEKLDISGDVATWQPSNLVPNTSRLMVGDKEELPLKAMQVNARVDGFRARVLIDLYFLNDRDRQLEGSFQLRLPGEASPYFFAFGEITFDLAAASAGPAAYFYSLEDSRSMGFGPREILDARARSWTEVKEARMVPREKAAFAYRETVRRVVDPALLEWSGAGIFSARVFPLRPKKLARVVIGYDVDLNRAGEDLEYRLDLPQGVPDCVVDLNAAAPEGIDLEVKPGAVPLKDQGRSIWRFQDPADKVVTLRVKGLGPTLLTGIDPKTGPYFAARFRPGLPSLPAASGSPQAVFLADTSLSSNPEKFGIWLKLLRGILDGNRDRLKSFAVLFFNIESFWWKEGFTENTPEAVDALLAFANRLSLEGATDLGSALKEAARPSWQKDGAPAAPAAPAEPWDLFLLSDGSPTWGDGDLYALSAALESGRAGALFAYSTGLSGTDLNALGHLARESGGAVFSVAGEAEIEKASTAHRARPWHLAGISLEGGSDLLIAGRPQSLFPGQEILLAGRGSPRPGAEIVLTLRQGDEEKVLHTKLQRSLDSDLAPRAYAQAAVGQLEDLLSAAEPIARAYATHFRVTGRTCSLLMLESEQDYLRYGIKPEEDAFVVKGSAASEVVARTLKDLGDALGDPKAAFLAWLKKLEEAPGLEFKVETALKLALGSMPTKAFAVEPSPLHAKLRTWDGVPGKLQEALASRDLDYDTVSAEALRRLAEYGPADALRAASSLVEASPGDGVTARDVGFSALEWGLGGQAYHLFRRVSAARPFEPENYRAMALCLEELKDADLAMACFEVGLGGKWDGRFGEFRRILGLEYLRFLRRIEKGDLVTAVPDFVRARLETVTKEFDPGPADLLVTITWNTDGTDVDLHVVEPDGEECLYSHSTTQSGGHITQDVTQGYGPEMYLLKKAPAGRYRIAVHYFASDRNRASTRTKVYATVFEGWGTPAERITRKVVTLAEGKEMHDLATVVMGK